MYTNKQPNKARLSMRLGAALSLCAVLLPLFGVHAAENGLVMSTSATLGSASNTLTANSIPASDFVKIVVRTEGFTSSDRMAIRFNGDSGTNYGLKYEDNEAGYSSLNSQTEVRLQNASQTEPATCFIEIWGTSSTTKHGQAHCVHQSGSGAAFNPTQSEAFFSWNNTSSAITSVTLLSLSANNMNTGAKIQVFTNDSSQVAAFPANANGYLKNDGSGSLTWDSASTVKTNLSLNNVENTALSTWAGSTSITTLGTVGTGTWNATAIGVGKGGTGQTSFTDGQILIGQTSGNTLSKTTLTAGTNITINNGSGAIEIIAAGGGGGGSLPADDEGYLWNDGTGALYWEPGTGTTVTNYDTMFDALALFLFFFNFVIFGFTMFYKTKR